ncbi:MAG: JAB domain-containing protein [Candidatus Hydrogenedentes bacterium]|nr:JAB domain-containing protein [Candidatus Hydrogenedentota bacterium]
MSTTRTKTALPKATPRPKPTTARTKSTPTPKTKPNSKTTGKDRITVGNTALLPGAKRTIQRASREYGIPIYRVALVREGACDIQRESVHFAIDVAAVFHKFLDNVDRENFCVMMLTTNNMVIGLNTVSVGTINMSFAVPREVFKPSLLSNASSVILCHNHPSGDPFPSGSDIELTARLAKAGAILGVTVLDHVIIGNRCSAHFSFRESMPYALEVPES